MDLITPKVSPCPGGAGVYVIIPKAPLSLVTSDMSLPLSLLSPWIGNQKDLKYPRDCGFGYRTEKGLYIS
jgi:hypothetical protein